MNQLFVVVLAGGSGTRFWPKSRHLRPKQLSAIGDAEKSMLEKTLDRLEGFVHRERILIVTHEDQADATRQLVGDRISVILAEPEARNTANALALAALEVELMAQRMQVHEPIMISLHADHVIADEKQFRDDLLSAAEIAKNDYLTLLGIHPRYPETGYGYIERGDNLEQEAKSRAFRVKSFREKPEFDLANQYVESGRFYWNAGLFVWKNQILIDELEKRLSGTMEALRTIKPGHTHSLSSADKDALRRVYAQLPKISIDHAILETSDRVAVLETDFGWQDVGSWDALSQCFPTNEQGNLLYGDTMMIDCADTTVDTDGYFVAGIGLRNMVVVVSQGAVLVCPKDRAQDVKHIVERLKSTNRNHLI